MLVMCRRGTTRTCTGACGSMSWNAITSSSWRTTRAGIFPSTIWQNRQDTAEQCTPSAGLRRCVGQLPIQLLQEGADVAGALAEVPGAEGGPRAHAHVRLAA